MRRNLYDGEKDGKYYIMSPSRSQMICGIKAADDYAQVYDCRFL